MKIRLELTHLQYREIWVHLLPPGVTQESAVFLLTDFIDEDGVGVFKIKDIFYAENFHFDHQYEDYLELSDETRQFLIKKAHDLIEPEKLDSTNLNRYVGARHDDVGKYKTEIAERMIKEIDPEIEVELITAPLESEKAFEAIKAGDIVLSGFDHDGPRFILNELCVAYDKPLIDMASDVPEAGVYGGRVAVVKKGHGCLYCMDLLDMEDVRKYLTPGEQIENEAAVYGIGKEHLKQGTGPSVISINGVVASLGVTEFMAMMTGLRESFRLINYYGHTGKVVQSKDEPHKNCPYCEKRGVRQRAEVERYIKTKSK